MDLRRIFGQFRTLAVREGDWPGALRWFALSLIGRPGLVRVHLRGEQLLIRAATSDLETVLHTLADDYAPVIAGTPALEHGLIVDGSSGIGTAAIVLARAFPYARVVSVEPSRDNFALLAWNTRNLPNISLVHGTLVPSWAAADGQGVALVTEAEDYEDFDEFDEIGAFAPREDEPAGQVTLGRILADAGRGGIDILRLDGTQAALTADIAWGRRTRAIWIERDGEPVLTPAGATDEPAIEEASPLSRAA